MNSRLTARAPSLSAKRGTQGRVTHSWRLPSGLYRHAELLLAIS